MEKELKVPIKNEEVLINLNAGDKVKITGDMFVFRDQVHKKIQKGEFSGLKNLDFTGACLYYCAPTLAKEGFKIGSCGPTSSYRMDPYTEIILKLGFRIMIGKGKRDDKIRDLCIRYKAIYVITYGGLGAYLNKFVKDSFIIAYPELSTEAMYLFRVVDFPGYIAIDCRGKIFP